MNSNDSGSDELIKQGKVKVQIAISRLEERSLFAATDPSTRILAIAGIELIHDLHAFDNFANWGKALGIQSRVVDKVDIYLGCSSVWAGHSKSNTTAKVALADRIIG